MATSTPVVFGASQSDTARDPKKVTTWISLLILYTVWGSTYLALAWVVEGLPPFLSAGARFIMAGFGLMTIGKLRGEPLPTRGQVLRAVPIGVLFFVIGNGFVAAAEREVSSSVAAIACGAMPLLTVLLGMLFGDKPARREFLGVALGLAGLTVMFGSELRADSSAIWLLFCAPLAWALGSQLTRRWKGPSGFMGAGLPMFFGGVLALALGASLRESVAWDSLGWRPVAAFFYLVVVGSMVAFTAFTWLLKNTRPSVATSYAYVNPAVALLLGVVLGGETLTMASLLGGALIASGVYLVIALEKRAPAAAR